MSKFTEKPYIEAVLAELSGENKAKLLNLINGKNAAGNAAIEYTLCESAEDMAGLTAGVHAVAYRQNSTTVWQGYFIRTTSYKCFITFKNGIDLYLASVYLNDGAKLAPMEKCTADNLRALLREDAYIDASELPDASVDLTQIPPSFTAELTAPTQTEIEPYEGKFIKVRHTGTTNYITVYVAYAKHDSATPKTYKTLLVGCGLDYGKIIMLTGISTAATYDSSKYESTTYYPIQKMDADYIKLKKAGSSADETAIKTKLNGLNSPGRLFLNADGDKILVLTNITATTPYTYTWKQIPLLAEDATPSDGGISKKYMHVLTIEPASQYYNYSGVKGTIVIFASESTALTISSLNVYLSTNGFTAINKLYPVNMTAAFGGTASENSLNSVAGCFVSSENSKIKLIVNSTLGNGSMLSSGNYNDFSILNDVVIAL